MTLIDLMRVEELGQELCLWDTDLFEESALLELYRSLTKVDQLQVIELLMKPTGSFVPIILVFVRNKAPLHLTKVVLDQDVSHPVQTHMRLTVNRK